MFPVFKTFNWHAFSIRAALLAAVMICVSVALAADGAETKSPSLQPAMLNATGTHQLWQNDPNLTGTGILIGAVCRSQSYLNDQPLNDYHFNMQHNSLYDADVVFADGSEGKFGLSDHATAIAGILLGLDEAGQSDDLGTFQYRGACPDASVNAFEWEQFVLRYLYRSQPIESDIITLSLGDIFELPWTRALEKRVAENDIIVIAGIGNGDTTHTPVLYPAAGANAIGVGVVDTVMDEAGNLSLSDFSVPTAAHSSTGPTDNQRCKPDLVAPGTALVPAYDDRAKYEIRENWSSLAAPAVSGTTALLLHKVEQTPKLKQTFDRPGKSSVTKAILLNAAAKLPYWHKGDIAADDDHDAPLDYTQGAGMLDGQQAMIQLTAGLNKPGDVEAIGWDNNTLNPKNTERVYRFETTNPNQYITATLCWNRFYQNQYPFRHDLDRDTDLRLELWGTNETEPNAVLLDYSDSVNDNVEHIYFKANAEYTQYDIRVRFNDQQEITDQIRQRYALAWSVTDDRQADNPWWNDLNGDNTMDDTLDNLIAALLEAGDLARTLESIGYDQLKLTPDRADLLTRHWDTWKQYIKQ